uniref:Uncharacterized protein n=1 Tax=Triticum urartu TaxID=4572 RepID=A0A8R7QWU4_TRIUA
MSSRSRSATAPTATRRQTNQVHDVVHDVWLYSSTLVATILLPPLPWFSSSSSDTRFGGNKLSNCSRPPRLGGGAPSH